MLPPLHSSPALAPAGKLLSYCGCTAGLAELGCRGLVVVGGAACRGVVGCKEVVVLDCRGVVVLGCRGVVVLDCRGLVVLGCRAVGCAGCWGSFAVGCAGLYSSAAPTAVDEDVEAESVAAAALPGPCPASRSLTN